MVVAPTAANIRPRTPEVPLRTQSAMTTITRAVTVAAGVLAPGHLGELTQYLPLQTLCESVP